MAELSGLCSLAEQRLGCRSLEIPSVDSKLLFSPLWNYSSKSLLRARGSKCPYLDGIPFHYLIEKYKVNCYKNLHVNKLQSLSHNSAFAFGVWVLVSSKFHSCRFCWLNASVLHLKFSINTILAASQTCTQVPFYRSFSLGSPPRRPGRSQHSVFI